MKKLKYALASVLLLAGHSISAQHHEFKVGIGYQRTWMIDQQTSPLRYQSSEKTFLLGYNHFGSTTKFDIKLNGSLGNFFPTGFANRKWYNTNYVASGGYTLDSNSMIGNLYNGILQFGFAKLVNQGISKNGNTTFNHSEYAGGSISNEIFYSDNAVREGWMNSTAINGTYESIHVTGKHSLSLKLTIPFVIRVSRLPYHNTISDPNNGEVKTFFKSNRFAWLGNYHQARLEAEYCYSVSKYTSLGVRYQGNFLRYGYEKPINRFQNNISIIGSFK